MSCRACTAGACAVPRQSLVIAPSLPSRRATRPHAMKYLSNHTVKRADRPTEVGGGWQKESTSSRVSSFNNIYNKVILLGQSQEDLHNEAAAAAGALRLFVNSCNRSRSSPLESSRAVSNEAAPPPPPL